MPADGEPSTSSVKPVETVVQSGDPVLVTFIDAGGMRRRLPARAMRMGEDRTLKIRASVIRQLWPEGGGPRLALDSRGLSPHDQNAVIRYVFLRQQELLRRGLLASE